MTGSPSIFRKNPEWDKRLVKMLKKGTREIAVGFPRGEATTSDRYPEHGEKEGPTVLQVAIWNNYGTRRIPARPFMQQAVPRVIKVVNRLVRAQVKKLEKRGKNVATITTQDVEDLAADLGQPPTNNGKDELNWSPLERFYRLIGQAAQDELRQTITDGDYAPNAPRTIAQKTAHSDHPLIDTGKLRKSVRYVVRDKK